MQEFCHNFQGPFLWQTFPGIILCARLEKSKLEFSFSKEVIGNSYSERFREFVFHQWDIKDKTIIVLCLRTKSGLGPSKEGLGNSLAFKPRLAAESKASGRRKKCATEKFHSIHRIAV